MKIINGLPCGDFSLCYGYASAGEVIAHPNTLSKNTHNHIYVLEGGITVTNGTTTHECVEGQWRDLSEFSSDRILTFTMGDNGGAWVVIIPQIVGETYTVTEVNDETVAQQNNAFLLVTVGYDVTFNGKSAQQLQFAKLTKDVAVVRNGGKVHKLVKN